MASHQRQQEHPGRCHLRRIGCQPAAAGIADVIHFEKDVTLLGRRREVVDYFLSSRGGASDCVSRLHARVIRAPGAYQLVDCSLTGVYVNDTRIGGKVVLQKGDTVVFGHPTERHLKPGTRVRQPNSQLCFLFEHCCCGADRDETRSSVPQVPLPPSAPPEAPQPGSDLVFEERVRLPAGPPATRALQDIPEGAGTPAKPSACPGEVPAAPLSLPFNSVASVASAAESSVPTNFTDVTSSGFEERSHKSPAISDAPQEGCTLWEPLFLRSASPEYRLTSRDSAGTAEPVQQAAFGPQEHVSGEGKLINPHLVPVEQSEGQACVPRSILKSCGLFLEEKRDREEVEMEVCSAVSAHEEPGVPVGIERADDEFAADTSRLQGWEGSGSELGCETAETPGFGTWAVNQLDAAKEDTNNVSVVRTCEEKAAGEAGPHAESSEERREPGACAREASRQAARSTEMETCEYYSKEENYSTDSSTDPVTDIRNNSENGNPMRPERALEGERSAAEQREEEQGAEHAGVAASAAGEAPHGAQEPQPAPGGSAECDRANVTLAGSETSGRGTASAASCSPNTGTVWENPGEKLLPVTSSDSPLRLGEIPSDPQQQHSGCVEQEQPLGDQALLFAAEKENPGTNRGWKATEISVLGSAEATWNSGSDGRSPHGARVAAGDREPREGNRSSCDPESPANSIRAELQEQPGEPKNQQEVDSCAALPADLERNVDLESGEDFVQPSLYPEDSTVEDAVWDEGDQENRSIEGLLSTDLEGSSDSAACQACCGVEAQAPRRGASMEQEGSSAGVCGTTTEHVESCKENRSEELEGMEGDPAAVAGFCQGGDFHFLEAEIEKTDSRGRETLPVQRAAEEGVAARDADGVSRSSVPCREPHGSGTDSRGAAAAAGSAPGAQQAAEGCVEQAGRPRSCTEHHPTAVKPTATACPGAGCIAAGAKCTLLTEKAPLGEEKETPAAEEHRSTGLYRGFNSLGLPAPPVQVVAESWEDCCSEEGGRGSSSPSQAGQGVEEDLLAETQLLQAPAQEGVGEAPAAPSQLPRAVGDSQVGEAQPELCPGAPGPGQAVHAGELLHGQGGHWGLEPLATQEQQGLPGSSAAELHGPEPGFAKGLDRCQETGANSPREASEREGSSRSLKRQVPENEGLGASDSEEEQLSQKRHCPPGLAWAEEPGASTAAAVGHGVREHCSAWERCGAREHRGPAGGHPHRQSPQRRPAARTAEAAGQQGSQGYVARLVREFFQGGRAEWARADARAAAPPRAAAQAEPPGAGATGAADGQGASLEPAALALASQRGIAARDTNGQDAPQPDADPAALVPPLQHDVTSKDTSGATCSPRAGSPSDKEQFQSSLCSAPGTRRASGSLSDEEQFQSSLCSAPGTRRASGSLSDEEQFQSSLCSVLGTRRASGSSPVSPLSVRSAVSPGFLLSDLSNSSTEGDCSRAAHEGSAGAPGSSEALAAPAVLDSAACCPETEAEPWADGDANTASYRDVAAGENGPGLTKQELQPEAEGEDGRSRQEASPSILHHCAGAPGCNGMANEEDSIAPSSPLPLTQTRWRPGAPLAWGCVLRAEGPGAPNVTASAASQMCCQRRPPAQELSDGSGRGTPPPWEAGGSSSSQSIPDFGNPESPASASPASREQGFPGAARLPTPPLEEEDASCPSPAPALLHAPGVPGTGSEEQPVTRPSLALAPCTPGAAEAPTSPLASPVQPRAEQDLAHWTQAAQGLLPSTPRSSGSLCGAGSSDGKARIGGRATSGRQQDWAVSEGDVALQLQRCQAVLADLSRVLRAVEGIDGERVEEWREQIDKLQRDTKMPRTSIAVVGNTGAGKSSLLNALLGEEAVLPTSAMRACTAAVVEISRAAEGSLYEADVEFLSREEWFGELEALLKDMKDKSGKLKKRYPDRKTEAGAAYSRVKAVYGTVAELAELEALQEVTQHLGTVKHVSAATAADFRSKIEKFIDSRTDNLRDMKGGEFWPIVKCVKIRVPKADVLKTGAVLVDLPGIRDSNAARDNVAKEYLKNCNAVWVVANINRAVDDKTAKEMLSINLRRQLLMDGQYRRLAFVCTKTDTFNVSEIISDLDLKDEIVPIERELEGLETQRAQLELEKETLYAELQQEQGQGPPVRNAASFQKENELRKNILEKELKISALMKEKEAKLHTISLICVQSRNQYSKQRIWQDFISGLQEMKRKAALADCEEDEYEEEMEDEELSSPLVSDVGEATSQHNKLQVFTVSSTEYLKLHGKLLREGRAQVFHNDEDTEIPALRRFAVRSALQHSMVHTEKLVRDVARVVSLVVNYLTNQRAEDHSEQAQLQEIIQTSLSRVPQLLQEAVSGGVQEIQHSFSDLLLSHLQRGARKAEDMCEGKVRSWGSPHFGYPYATYRAVCARNGVYSSLACGVVDFNEQLTEPIYSSISVAWNEVFSSQLGESIEQFSKAVLDRLNQFFEELKNKLPAQGRDTHPVNLIQQQQMEAAQALLRNFILNEVEYIGKRQRRISRILTPEVQTHMKPIYAACNQLNGPGSFQRMKDLMQDYIHEHKQSMFSTATYKLQQQLELLKQYICGTFECVVQDLNKTLARQFEPMLKTVQKNDSVIPDLVSICGKVQQLCKLSCVDYVLPSPGHIGAGSMSTGAEDEWESAEPPDFVGRCRVVRVGPWHLAHVASVQSFSVMYPYMLPPHGIVSVTIPLCKCTKISVRETTVHFGGNMSLTVPFSSVYLCECCFHLYYLNLHVSPEGTRDIYSRWGAQAAPANLDSVEVLVVLETPEVPGSFRRLLEFISEQRSGTAWFRELGLQQGREKLESLQVYYTATESKYALEEELAEIPASGFPEDLPAGSSSACQAQAGPWLQVNGRKRGADVVPGAEKRLRSGAGEQGPAAQPNESLLHRQQIPSSLELWGRSTTPGDAAGTSTRSPSAFPKAEVKREPEPEPLSQLQLMEAVSFTPSALLKVETCENQGQNAPDLPGAPRSARVFP